MDRLGGSPDVVLQFLEEHFTYGKIEETDANQCEQSQHPAAGTTRSSSSRSYSIRTLSKN